MHAKNHITRAKSFFFFFSKGERKGTQSTEMRHYFVINFGSLVTDKARTFCFPNYICRSLSIPSAFLTIKNDTKTSISLMHVQVCYKACLSAIDLVDDATTHYCIVTQLFSENSTSLSCNWETISLLRLSRAKKLLTVLQFSREPRFATGPKNMSSYKSKHATISSNGKSVCVNNNVFPVRKFA